MSENPSDPKPSAESRVTLDLSDNPDLQAYFKNRQPGDKYSLRIEGSILENNDRLFAGDVSKVVEEETASPEAEETQPEGDGAEPDAAVGEAVKGALFKSKK